MANVNVTYGNPESVSSKLNSGEQDLQNTLRNLKSLVDQRVASGFVTDKASGEFQRSYEDFNKGASQTIQGLTGMSNFLDKAKQSMQDLDSSLASAARQ